VLPLMPEFITPQDGAEKQDCERNDAKRWLERHGRRMRELRPVYWGDALFSCQSLAEAVLATGADFLLVCKKDSHKTLYEFVEGASLDEHTVTEHRPGKHSLTYHYRWIEGFRYATEKTRCPSTGSESASSMPRGKRPTMALS
jgi:hypothetical protein